MRKRENTVDIVYKETEFNVINYSNLQLYKML